MKNPKKQPVRALQMLVAAGGVALATPAAADVVLDWNQTAEAASVAAGGPPQRIRVLAMAQVAVHDALNSIVPRYETYLPLPAARAGASAEAAVVAAAYRVMLAQVPSQSAALGTAYANSLAALPDCPAAFADCVEDGLAAGEAAAYAILADRVGDGSAIPHLPYTLAPGPGVYQPTAPNFAPPAFAGWAKLKPFVLRSGSQFRAERPEMFDLRSDEYTRDFLEVKRVGAADAEALGFRTAAQSGVARFWPGGGASLNGAAARTIVAGRGLDLWEHARLFALLGMATSDSAIVAYDTKYTYNFWRPVTAIRNADIDGNKRTTADPNWLSYLVTPAYPDFTCGLTNNVGAGIGVLRSFFRTDHIAFTFTAGGLPPAVTRTFASLSEAGADAVDARVFGGMHFRTGCVIGLRQGEKVGRYAVKHFLKPARSHGERDDDEGDDD